MLRIFGVSLPIVRVAGGLLVTANGWRLLNDQSSTNPSPHPVEAWEREVARRAFYPLTFPLTVGPGSISRRHHARCEGAEQQWAGPWRELLAGLVGVLIVSLIVFLSYRFASRLDCLSRRNRHRGVPAAVVVHPAVRRRRDHLERRRGSGPAAADTLK